MFDLTSATLLRGDSIKETTRPWITYVYLANNVEIQLHDHFSGSIEIVNPLGLISIPRGFAPWDEMSPSGLAISMHPSK